jgi:hypothetical protein
MLSGPEKAYLQDKYKNGSHIVVIFCQKNLCIKKYRTVENTLTKKITTKFLRYPSSSNSNWRSDITHNYKHPNLPGVASSCGYTVYMMHAIEKSLQWTSKHCLRCIMCGVAISSIGIIPLVFFLQPLYMEVVNRANEDIRFMCVLVLYLIPFMVLRTHHLPQRQSVKIGSIPEA